MLGVVVTIIPCDLSQTINRRTPQVKWQPTAVPPSQIPWAALAAPLYRIRLRPRRPPLLRPCRVDGNKTADRHRPWMLSPHVRRGTNYFSPRYRERYARHIFPRSAGCHIGYSFVGFSPWGASTPIRDRCFAPRLR